MLLKETDSVMNEEFQLMGEKLDSKVYLRESVLLAFKKSEVNVVDESLWVFLQPRYANAEN